MQSFQRLFSLFRSFRGLFRDNCSLTPISWFGRASIVVLFLLPPLVLAQDGKWVVDPQIPGVAQDAPLCRNLLKYMNDYQGCPGGVMRTFPGFSSPPWQELDPNEHLDLIWRLLMYSGRADVYFRRGQAANATPIPDTQATRRAATDFVAAGGKLRVWRTRLFNNYAFNQPAPLGDQTIVEMYQSLSPEQRVRASCPDSQKLLDSSTYIVTADLKGPDPHVDAGTAGLLESGGLLMHEGLPYLVIGYGHVILMQTSANFPDSYPLRFCGFRYNPLGGDK